ncbi:head GIN domain-containing protein [Hymenobacter metallicola]|uniref:DUF2807 domain-containing protein n=1 Tax=Hymenobacter metallicola TaxID=2563114 RepID=A0A4Z0Q9N2_9BACT|nr:head GIN domain-containing protein [Hymenobacter metallicola]TGE26404.1 DUF2807 domain-containing protein [Hymenobacter metallicola]
MKTLRLLSCTLVFLTGLLFSVHLRAAGRAADREVREVAAFTEITLANSATVVVTQGSPQKVEVEASAEDLRRLETTVSNGKLRIGIKSELRSVNLGKITVYITVPEINALAVSGSGFLKAGSVKTNALQVSVSGSGRLEVAQLQTTELNSSVSGSGSVSLAGSSPRHSASISGSGSIKANDLRSETCQVSISGSGTCRLNVARSLDASLRGSGNVYVTGNPTINSKTTGSGRVHRS